MVAAAARYSLHRLRNGAIHFLSGRLLAAAAGLVTTLLFAWFLSPAAYGAYSVMLGLTLLLGTLTSFLSEVPGQRFLPELLVHGQWGLLRFLVRYLIWFRLFSLLAAISLTAWGASWLAGLLAIRPYAAELRLWSLAILAVVFYRFCIILLEVFMLQRLVKWIEIVFASVRLGMAAVCLWLLNGLDLLSVVMVEVVANSVGLVAALAGLSLFLARQPATPADGRGSAALLSRLHRFSGYGYLRNLILLCSGEASNRLVVARYLPPLQVAAFGFAQSLAAMALRYMPSFFLRNLIRPAMMANFARRQSSSELGRQANFVFKMNCLALLPVVVGLALGGDQLALLLSGGKYPDAGWMLTMLVAMLILQDHYSILEAHLHALEENRLLLWGGVVQALFLIPALYLVQRFGVVGFLAARVAGIVARNSLVAGLLAGKGVAQSTDWAGLGRLLAAAALPLALLLPLRPAEGSSLPVTAGLIFAGGLLYLAALPFVKPFTRWEKGMVNRLAGRRIFVPVMAGDQPPAAGG